VKRAFLLLALAPLAAATAQAPDRAAELARAVLPRDKAIAVRVPRFDAAFAIRLATDARITALEPRHPGLTKAVAAAAHDEAVKAYGAAVDRLQAEAAQLYRTRFSPAELAVVATFFASPTGRTMIDLSMESSGDTAGEFEADRRQRLMALLKDPDEQTKADLTRLIQSGLLPKIQALAPEVSALSTRRFDDAATLVDAALPARIDATIASVTSRTK
jgi:hypothetical protein